MSQLADVCGENIRTLLRASAAEHDGPTIQWERESRRAFENAALDESLWSAWIDEWIHAAYEQAHVQLHPLDFECLTDWCTCGDSRADHSGHCEHAHCDCRGFKRSARRARPRPRRTPQTWTKPTDAHVLTGRF